MRKTPVQTLLCLAALAVFTSVSYSRNERETVGRIEWITLPSYNLRLEARVDTGARKCSLHSINEREVQVGGENFVEFTTLDNSGKAIRLKSRVFRKIRIRSTSGESTNRYVIREKVTLGKLTREVYINLNDRSALKYKFLVGRNFLRGSFIVDVSRSHMLAD